MPSPRRSLALLRIANFVMGLTPICRGRCLASSRMSGLTGWITPKYGKAAGAQCAPLRWGKVATGIEPAGILHRQEPQTGTTKRCTTKLISVVRLYYLFYAIYSIKVFRRSLFSKRLEKSPINPQITAYRKSFPSWSGCRCAGGTWAGRHRI